MVSYVCILLSVCKTLYALYCIDIEHHVSRTGITFPILQMGKLRFGRGWDLPEVIELFLGISFGGPPKAGLCILHASIIQLKKK